MVQNFKFWKNITHQGAKLLLWILELPQYRNKKCNTNRFSRITTSEILVEQIPFSFKTAFILFRIVFTFTFSISIALILLLFFTCVYVFVCNLKPKTSQTTMCSRAGCSKINLCDSFKGKQMWMKSVASS